MEISRLSADQKTCTESKMAIASTCGDIPGLPATPVVPPQKPSDELTGALDLGTNTGWVLVQSGNALASGTWVLATEKELSQQRKQGTERSLDIRFLRLLQFLEQMRNAGVTRFVYEDVIFVRNQAPAQLWASLRAAVWVIGRNPAVRVFCVPVATLKEFATGNGGAKKEEMAQALAQAEPAVYHLDPASGLLQKNARVIDDNEVDAIWLARFTAAVDRGEESFSGVYQRKMLAKAERRAKRAAVRAQKRAKREAQDAQERAERQALTAAVKATGKCCGVFRKPAPFGRAACPKCGKTVKLTPASLVDSLPLRPDDIEHPTAAPV